MTVLLVLTACGGGKAKTGDSALAVADEVGVSGMEFDADSAYSYVAHQVEFGPRVPNTQAHRICGDWIESELRRHGAEVTVQNAELEAFDGTKLNARNFLARYNPEVRDRLLLLAHWDCRPWADEDPDPAKRKLPVDGANDGASGTGILLEIARQLGAYGSDKGIDLLFVDAEDWGSDGDDESWALGTRHFINNIPVDNFSPSGAILLDMVGGKGAVFCREYFSQQSNPSLADKVWATAASLGYGEMFPNRMGGAVNDDHLQLIENGIPAIDIIEYHPGAEGGFNPNWHTTHDTMDGISKETLEAVGKTVAAVCGLGN